MSTSTNPAGEVNRALVDGIPVIWVLPGAGPAAAGSPAAGAAAPARLALWLTHLGGTKEQTVPMLRDLAAAGFVAVSLDPWQHGERAIEPPPALAARVFGGFRRHMWPILGQTALDCLRVIDWAEATLGCGPEVVAGGVSMGGDIAVALAGVEPRVSRVAAVVATPDWTRPGMADIRDPTRILPQGDADAYARWFYDRLDPLTHLDSYARGPAITFECGADDTHVPPDSALKFQAALGGRYPDAAGRVRVTLHPGLTHSDGATDPAPTADALAWLRQAAPPTNRAPDPPAHAR